MQWRCQSTSSGQCTLDGLIAWLSADEANEAVVADDFESIPVCVVRPAGGRPYVCAWAQSRCADTLLALPTF